MHAINTENTTALYAKANEVADFIETEIINSIGRHHFAGDNTVRFSYIPEAVKGLEHKSVLYSPNFKIYVEDYIVDDGKSKLNFPFKNISYPKIDFPTDGIFLGNVANLLKMQKISVKEINRDRGYIIFEWSIDTQEWVTDSAKPERKVDNLTPEEREKFNQLWVERARNEEL